MRTLKLLLLPLLAPLLVSCLATRAALEDATAATARLNAVMDDQEATVGEMAEAAEDQAEALAGVLAAQAQDAAAIIDAAKSGLNWPELAAGLLGTALTAMYGVNKLRDGARVKRGEATGITPIATKET